MHCCFCCALLKHTYYQSKQVTNSRKIAQKSKFLQFFLLLIIKILPGVDEDVLILDVPMDSAQLLTLQDGLHNLHHRLFSQGEKKDSRHRGGGLVLLGYNINRYRTHNITTTYKA